MHDSPREVRSGILPDSLSALRSESASESSVVFGTVTKPGIAFGKIPRAVIWSASETAR